MQHAGGSQCLILAGDAAKLAIGLKIVTFGSMSVT